MASLLPITSLDGVTIPTYAQPVMAVLFLAQSQNTARHRSSTNWSLAIFWFTAMAMLFHITLLALLCSWVLPKTWLASLPYSNDPRVAVVYWLYPLLLLDFLLTAGGGMFGWMVITALYQIVMIAMLVYGILVVRLEKKEAAKNPVRKLTNAERCEMVVNFLETPFRSTAASRRTMTMMTSFTQSTAGLAYPALASSPDLGLATVSDEVRQRYRRKLAIFYSKHNPSRFHHIDNMLENYQGVEERLIAELRRKYGVPEPPPKPLTGSTNESDVDPDDDLFGVPVKNGDEETAVEQWSHLPQPMGKRQQRIAIGMLIGVVASVAGLFALLYLWRVPDYVILVRSPDPANVPPAAKTEVQDGATAKVIQLMYSWPGLATDMRQAVYVKLLTEECGTNFRQFLPVDQRQQVLNNDWVLPYQINMSWYQPAELTAYTSVNDWFIRYLVPFSRPLDDPTNPLVVSSPTDARTVIFPSLTAATRLWVKGGWFNYPNLIGVTVDGDPNYFNGGSVAISRLAPEDYHHFHSPIRAVVRSITVFNGTYWSVSSDAVRSWNSVLYNTRTVVILEFNQTVRDPRIANQTTTALPSALPNVTTAVINATIQPTSTTGSQTASGTYTRRRKFAFVAIGATCIGSVVMQTRPKDTIQAPQPLTVGAVVNRGDELGFMQFGGSTVVTLFKRGDFIPDCDILAHSSLGVETYVRMGQRVGQLSDDMTDVVACALH